MTPIQDDDLLAVQQKIIAQQFEPALADLTALLDVAPDNTEAVYMTAVCHRYLGQSDAALLALNRLKSLAPGHGRAHQEEGHVYRSTGQPDLALQAYRRACQFNPALEASFRYQLELLSNKGMKQQARAVKAQLERLLQLPAPLRAVTDLIAQGKLIKAENLCRQFLQKVPHHVDGMRLLADIGTRLGILDDAEVLLESATTFDPANIQARIEYVQVLRKRQKFTRALAEAKGLLETDPDNLQFQSIYAIECMQTGDYDTALATFDRVLERIPNDPVTLTSRGHALKTCGQSSEAIADYRAAIESQPRHGEAYYSLANLKTYSFEAAEIKQMHRQEADSNLSYADRVYLCFALGKAYEDKRDFDTSFKYYQLGNNMKKAQSRYSADKMTEELAAQRRVCTSKLFEEKAGAGCESPDPIFIVGLPRAGSTLLEQILSSHSMVDGTLELPNILSLSHRLRRGERITAESKYPAALTELTAEELLKFGEEYIADTRVHRRDAPHFIDKMPNNFRHIGLIKLILPNAKIIDARRDPMACCFSAFKQLFAEGQEFSYDLEDLGQYYADYVELMDHWDEVLPGFVLRVQHEDVVADLEAEVRRMLDFCGLSFEENCLAYYETERSIRTPSSEQVRQPIFTTALEQWRNYETHLTSLKRRLSAGLPAQ